MSRIPRTPAYWPRMKVRGRRNRAKLAARYTTRQAFFHVALFKSEDRPGAIEMRAGVKGVPTHTVMLDGPTMDGYGRIVATPRTTVISTPPRPPQYSVSFEVTGVTSALFDLMTGKADARHGP